MTDRQTTIERAFEFARSGRYVGATEIKEQLRREGYGDRATQISGPMLLRQLRQLCAASRALKAADAPRDDRRRVDRADFD